MKHDYKINWMGEIGSKSSGAFETFHQDFFYNTPGLYLKSIHTANLDSIRLRIVVEGSRQGHVPLMTTERYIFSTSFMP